MRSILTATFLTLAALPALAVDFKVGYVDIQRVFQQAPSAIKAAKDIENEFSARDKELQAMAKRLQTMQENLERNAVTMSESERRNKEREFAEVSRDFQRKQREFREDLSMRQSEEQARIIERANKAVSTIAENEKFDLIIQEAVWINPALDITDRVIKALSNGK
ncbi:MAG: OmpH family outer membrane protein [Betaproteobacteria bacterium]|nr:OmpH family outer membrane protein [Betaproteobacteria bacterium]